MDYLYVQAFTSFSPLSLLYTISTSIQLITILSSCILTYNFMSNLWRNLPCLKYTYRYVDQTDKNYFRAPRRSKNIFWHQNQGKVTYISIVTGTDSKVYAYVNSHNTDRYKVPWDLGWGDRGIKFNLALVHY